MKNANVNNVSVYTNTPIGDDSIDYVGLRAYSDHVEDALSKSNTIGIIGDFGTGKSSLIEYLKNNQLKDKFNVAPINLWSISKSSENSSVDIHVHFLYQLAMRLTSQRFSKSINRRVNRNYGLLSVDLNIFSSIFWLMSVVLYVLYAFLKPEDTSWLDCILDVNNAGITLLASVFCLFIGIFKASITVSSGKNENEREVNSNEIVDAYKDILKYNMWKQRWNRVCPRRKSKKVVIVIEDLDRSSDNSQAYNFLQELNRYYINSLDDNEREKIKFIVNIRPEKDFAKGKDASIYSKVFDYTINLFPINSSNYDVILDNLLNEQKDTLKEIGINVFPNKNTQRIPGMKRIIYGKDITLRDVKERLNCAILIYSSLYSNITDEERLKNVKFEKCAFVAYLKNTYPSDYLKIYKNSEFEEVIIDYAVRNRDYEYDLEESLINALPRTDSKFIYDLRIGIRGKLIDTDYRMYFYNYPKDAYIRSLSEAIVYDAVMYDEEYSPNFDISLNEAIMFDKDIIGNTYEERRCLTNDLPRVTFRNGLLFEHCIINYKEDTFENLKSVLEFDDKAITRSKIILENLFSLKLDKLNWNKLVYEYTEEFKKLFVEKLKNIDAWNILVVRKIILDFFADQIQCFDYLFSKDYPSILAEEIRKINDIDKVLTLSLMQPIGLEAVKEIHNKVINKEIEKGTENLVRNLYDNIADLIIENEEVGMIFAAFSEKVGQLSIKRENYLFGLAENNTVFKEVYIKVLNDTNCIGASPEIVAKHIKQLEIKEGLEITVAEKVLKGKDDQLFISNLLSANYNINNIIEHKEVLEEEILAVYEDDGETIVAKLRNEVLSAAKNNSGILNEFDFIFKKPMYMITEDELLNVPRMEDALRVIDCEQVELDNVKHIAEYINRKGARHPRIVNKVLTFIIDINGTVAKQLFQLLDFSKIAYKSVSYSKRKNFIETIEENFKLVSDKLEIVSFLKCINYLEKDLEKRLIGGFTDEESIAYKELLDKINAEEIDDVTINVLTTSGYYSVHNADVQKKLYEYKQYGRYVYAKTLKNKKFEFEKDDLNLSADVYKKLLNNSNFESLHKLMFENIEFREYAIEEKFYSELDDEMIFYFTKGIQNKDLIGYIFTKENSVSIKYLSQINAIENIETEEFLLEKLDENPKVLVDSSVYRNVRKCITDINIRRKYKNKRNYRKKKITN